MAMPPSGDSRQQVMRLGCCTHVLSYLGLLLRRCYDVLDTTLYKSLQWYFLGTVLGYFLKFCCCSLTYSQPCQSSQRALVAAGMVYHTKSFTT